MSVKSDRKSSPNGFSYGHSGTTMDPVKPNASKRTKKSKSGATENPSSPN